MSKKRVLLGLSIIAGGVCASLPFRREKPLSLIPQSGSSAAIPSAVAPLLSEPLTASSPSSEALSAGSPSPYLDDGSQRFSNGDSPDVSAAMAHGEGIPALPREQVHAAPMLPVSFHVKEPEPNRLEAWQPSVLEEGPAGPPREYRIRKLDTLEDLAERFLGAKDRAEELFEANRGVLHDRHILPLGAVLRIPPGVAPTESVPEDSDLQPVRPGP